MGEEVKTKRMKTTLTNQRKERDKLLSQNYLIRRTANDFDSLLQNHNVKLITGPRRVGKSTQALLMLRDKNFAYLNFDDNNLLSRWDEDLVMNMLDDIYPGYEYLLLDEVQNVEGWDVWVSKLYRRGLNMVITGSNANMLSGEMSTMLTGRYIEIRMLPFSLEETLAWNKLDDEEHIKNDGEAQANAICEEYLRNGGYPESVAQRTITESYLSTLFDSIVLKDVVRRHNVRNITDINNTAIYLLSNCCSTLSYNDVASNLGLASVATTKKYMDYLHEPFLFFYLPRFNYKLKLMNKAPRKVYVVDNGFIAARGFNISENLGHMLENQVFIELLRRGYDAERSLFYYHSRNDKETDFVLRDGASIKQLVQVCYDMRLPKTEKREVDSIIECAEELKCENLTIVTKAEERIIEKNGHTIFVVPIMKFSKDKYQ